MNILHKIYIMKKYIPGLELNNSTRKTKFLRFSTFNVCQTVIING